MALDYFDYISSFTGKFKKTKVLCEEVDAATYEYLAAKNKSYADFIKKEGFCSYENGLFSLINPMAYEKELALPGIVKLYGGDVVLKSGFGDFIISELTHGTGNAIHRSFYNGEGNIGSGVGYLLTFQLPDATFQKNFLKKKLFKQAVEKFGTLKHDENFGFPMDFPWAKEKDLEKIENVSVYKTREYLKLLSQKYA
jgi:hypothetical protein